MGTPAGATFSVLDFVTDNSGLEDIVMSGDSVSDSMAMSMTLTSHASSTITYPPAPAPGTTGGMQIVARHSTVFECRDAGEPTIVDGIAKDWSYARRSDDEFLTIGVKAWNTDQTDATDLTYFRGVPTIVQSWEETDPFGHSIATISMPQCTSYDGPWDDPGTELVPSETWWLRSYANIDIYLYPCTEDQWNDGEAMVWHPLTGKKTLYVHELDEDGVPIKPTWEGWTFVANPSENGWTLSCKGSLWQLDNYQAKPMFPARPKPVEEMLRRYFDPRRRGLWTKDLVIEWGEWTKLYTTEDQQAYIEQGPRFPPTDIDIYTPWTGFNTRTFGSWTKVLTGYVQQMLGILYADPEWSDDEGMDGDQWTIRSDPDRTPVMYVRRQKRPTDAEVWVGQHGVRIDVASDSSAVYNVLFLSGKDLSTTAWQHVNYVTNPDSKNGFNRVSAQVPAFPLVGLDSLYVGDRSEVEGTDSDGFVVSNNLYLNYDGYYALRERAKGQWVVENYFQMPDGVQETEANKIAKAWVARNSKPGWQGTITIKCDLMDADGNYVSRYSIRPGFVITALGHQRTWEETQDVNRFHVAQVSTNWQTGEVTLTVDTKFRDLLSIEMAIAQGRDSLAPINSLRTGARSSQIDDLAAPWDDSAGSGIVPNQSKGAFRGVFPYADANNTMKSANQPRHIFKPAYLPPGEPALTPSDSPSHFIDDGERLKDSTQSNKKALYIPVCAGASNPEKRWAFIDDIIMSAQGTIMRSEFAAYDQDGGLAPVEMHISMYYQQVFLGDMPLDQATGKHSALWDGAFEPVDKSTNRPWADTDHIPGQSSPVGWGSFERPAGYSPGTNEDGGPPTGRLEDGSPWTFDMSQNSDYSDFEHSTDPSPTATALSMGIAIYARLPEVITGAMLTEAGVGSESEWRAKYKWVYIRGCFYRAISIGTGS